eukprot:EG_transcript_3151
MTLYDSNGHGHTVYVPSKLGGPNQGAPQPPAPAAAAVAAPPPPLGHAAFPAVAPGHPPEYLQAPPPTPGYPPPGQATAQASAPEPGMLYISNMPPCMTPDKLHRLLSTYGTVVHCRIMKKAELGNRIIGYARYQDSEMSRMALANLDGIAVDGWKLSVSPNEPEADQVSSSPSSNLYISNLPADCVDVGLRAVFSPYGHIVSLVVFKEVRTGLCKGSGMVRYSTTAEAAAAIQALHHQVLPGMDRPLEVKYAESKTERAVRRGQRTQECNTTPCPPELEGTMGSFNLESPQMDFPYDFQTHAGPPMHPAHFAHPQRPPTTTHLAAGPVRPLDHLPPPPSAPAHAPQAGDTAMASMHNLGSSLQFIRDLAAKLVDESGNPVHGNDGVTSYRTNTIWQPIRKHDADALSDSPESTSPPVMKAPAPSPTPDVGQLAYPDAPQRPWPHQWAGVQAIQPRR